MSARRSPLGVAIAPNTIGQHIAMALIDRVIADGLALEVIRNRVNIKAVALKDLALRGDVTVILYCSPRVEVVAPAGNFEAVITPRRCQSCDLFKGQICPLAGK